MTSLPPTNQTTSTPRFVRNDTVAKKTVRLTLVCTPMSVILRFSRWKAPISRLSWAKALTTRIPVSASAVRSVRFDHVSPQRVKRRRMRFQKTTPHTRISGTGASV